MIKIHKYVQLTHPVMWKLLFTMTKHLVYILDLHVSNHLFAKNLPCSKFCTDLVEIHFLPEMRKKYFMVTSKNGFLQRQTINFAY